MYETPASPRVCTRAMLSVVECVRKGVSMYIAVSGEKWVHENRFEV